MSIHDTLKEIYNSNLVIGAQVALPGLIMMGVNYYTGTSMLQGLGSSLAIAAIRVTDPKGDSEKEYFKHHDDIHWLFANPLRHALTSAIFYSAIQHAGLSHHLTMLLAKCCSTTLFSSHFTPYYYKTTVISLSICAAEALSSYVVHSTLGDNYYFAQFMANVVARSLAIAGSFEYKDHDIKNNLFGGITCGFSTSVADVLAPITGTSPIVKLIPESVSSFVSSAVESVSNSVVSSIS